MHTCYSSVTEQNLMLWGENLSVGPLGQDLSFLSVSVLFAVLNICICCWMFSQVYTKIQGFKSFC
jgi:hypothetical protein